MELSNNNTIIPIHPEAETARIIQHNKPCSITNGILKRHNHHHHHHPVPVVVVYKECLKNHAATMGANAVDGCGEFMPSPTATATNPTSLKCAACGCHRNFHRREPEEPFPPAAALEYQSHHRHHPPPPPPPQTTNRGSGDHSCPNSPSPPPISSAYYPAAPHMLLALSFGLSGRPVENNHLPINPNSTTPMSNPNGRKRFRTKFTQNQKERMLEFAERVGWRMQKQHEEVINKLCDEISVEKGVLKVWMHNNKNNFGRKDQTVPNNDMDMNGIDFGTNDNNKEDSHSHGVNHNNIVSLVTTNGSSSSLT